MRQFSMLKNRDTKKVLPKGSKSGGPIKIVKQETINYIQYPII